ncbi:MAG: type IV pilus twitching motility protein PilT [Armatimonadetes bacterium]|nr:type IV pilus twitching motility protein PilT [Armatimonadota bacterium]
MDMLDLLLETVKRGASDLHLSAGSPPMMRINGEMVPIRKEPLAPDELHTMLYDSLQDWVKARFEETKDVDFAIELKGAGRFRANLYMQKNGEGAVFRTIKSNPPSFDELRLPDAVRQLARKERGLVLVTGPTGSGKSTTLAAMVDLINSERKGHIITIEDPIEFIHPSKNCLVNQREVERHTHSFNSALRGALREDPDVVLVGELRDLETIELAIRAAETGHLVFGTLHTISAPKTIDRIIDVFDSSRQAQIRAQLAESLEGVVSQILLRTSNGNGRVAAREIMLCDAAVRTYLREGKVEQIPGHIETHRAQGMITLEQSLQELLGSGIVTREEIMKKARDLSSLQILLGQMGGGPNTPPPNIPRPAMPGSAPSAPANSPNLAGLNIRR